MQLFNRPPINSYRPVIIPEDMPVYQITGSGIGAGYFGVDENGEDHLYLPGSVLALENEEPNLQMKPLNKMAWARMDEFLDKIDDLGRKKAERDGKGFVSQKNAFHQMYAPATRNSRGAVMLNQETVVPQMKGKKKGTRIQEISPEQEAQHIQVAGMRA